MSRQGSKRFGRLLPGTHGPCLGEPLERRLLLASASVVHGILRITGDNADDYVDVATLGASTVVTLGQSPARKFTFNSTRFAAIRIDVKNGNDVVAVSNHVTKPATILGGNGDDCLAGGGGDDLVNPGLGNDTIDPGGTSENPGMNTLDYFARSTPLLLDNRTVTTGGETDVMFQGFQRFLSGSGDDTLYAYSWTDHEYAYLDAGGGDDLVRLSSYGYPDVTVHGGRGKDRILITSRGNTGHYFGDAGNDTFEVYRSSSTARDFHGGSGLDTVDWAGFLNEYFPVIVTLDDIANDGSPTEFKNQNELDNVHSDVERILGTPGPDTMIGSSGNEIFFGNGGKDWLDGAGGDDLLDGGLRWYSNWPIEWPGDTLIGGSGNDTLISGDTEDLLIGGSGIDHFTSDPTDTVIDQPVWFANGTLVLEGSERANRFHVRLANPATLVASIDRETRSFNAADVKRIFVFGRGGNDSVTIDPAIAIPATMRGGDGNDTLISGAGDDCIGGDGGKDWISGGVGSNQLLGGEGADAILGGIDKDSIVGGGGNDTIHGGDEADRIDGEAGNDLIFGDAANDFIVSGTGNDTISGGDGDDLFDTNYYGPYDNGNDSLSGDSGNDTITGNFSDTLRGGEGQDLLIGGLLLDGGAGNDTINGSGGTLLGGDGDDVLSSFTYYDYPALLDGGDGNDLLLAHSLTDPNSRSSASNTLLGDAGNDTLVGGLGDETLDGGDGNDSIDGGYGDDKLIGGPGFDTIDAGIGRDSVVSDADDLVRHAPNVRLYPNGGNSDLVVVGTVDNDTIQVLPKPGQPTIIQVIANGQASEFTRSAINYIYVSGSDGSDFIQISTQLTLRSVLTGGDSGDLVGSDTIFGGSGSDSIRAWGRGGNLLDGGAGDDTLTDSQGNDTLRGGDGNDLILASAGDDLLLGGGDNDYIQGGLGNDYIDCGAGNDGARGQEDNDTILGGDGNDVLYGNEGNDSLDCGTGDDTAYGSNGDDTLVGGIGADVLDGGDGNNTIIEELALRATRVAVRTAVLAK